MTAWLLTWLWQGSALATGVAVVLHCAPRRNAATRHLIWFAALVAVACLGLAGSPSRSPADLAPAGDSPIYIPSAPDLLISIFLGIWAAIALVSLLRVLPGLRGLYAVRDRCRPFPSNVESQLPLWLEAKECGRRTELAICDLVPGATVLGFYNPLIAIPSSLVRALTIDELDQVILHEHAHVRRRDDWSRLAQTLLVSVLWVHPAALLVSRALNREREMACDEWVIARTGLPKAYARCLARAAEVRVRLRGGPPLLPALIGSRHELVRRVDRVLGIDKARPRVSIAGATAAAGAMVVMSIQLQTMRGFSELAEIMLPQISGPVSSARIATAGGPEMPATVTVRLSAAARTVHASFGETRRSLGEGGKPDTTYVAPIASAFAPASQIASADKPVAPNAPNLSARAFPGSYALPEAPVGKPAEEPGGWKAMAAPSVEMAAAAKKTSVGLASAFSRAGASLARSF